MGGGTEIIQPPTAAAPTAGESAAEYAAALPAINQANLEYQPQIDQQQFDSYQTLAPQYAQLNQDVMQQFQPNQFALGEQLASDASNMAQNGLSADEMGLYKDQYKSMMGNQVNSPVGASFIGKNLMEQQMQAKQQGRNMGLSLSGKMPITQAQQPQSQFQVAPSFGQAFQTQTQGYGSNVAAARPGMYSKQGGLNLGMFGRFGGGSYQNIS